MLRFFKFAGAVALGAMLVAATGCRQLPGSDEQQGAAIGGVSGAAIGAAVGGSEHRLLGALLGGALGAGGGYLIGANTDKITGKDSDSAREASEKAQRAPATPAEARSAQSADLNTDGFVTMDELVAMEKAGLSDDEIVQRLSASGQVFELTSQQRDYLREQGLSQNVLDQLPRINEQARERLATQDAVIGRPANNTGGSSTIENR
jgi:hypothetical protein